MTHSTIMLPVIATSVLNCDRSIQVELLSAAGVYEQKLIGYRFKVSLASKELELDGWENPVPKDTKIIDIVVTKPTRSAIDSDLAPSSKRWEKRA